MKLTSRKLAFATAVIFSTNFLSVGTWAADAPADPNALTPAMTNESAGGNYNMNNSGNVSTGISSFKQNYSAFMSATAADPNNAANVKTCQETIGAKVRTTQAQYMTANNSIETQMGGLKNKMAQKGQTNSNVFEAHSLSKDATSASDKLAGVAGSFQGTFGSQRKVGDGAPDNAKTYPACSDNCKIDAAVQAKCDTLVRSLDNEIAQSNIMATNTAQGASTTWHMVEGGMIAAGVGAVALTVAVIHRHNDANARAKVANDLANGIIHNPDGTTTNCLTASTYTTSTCQPVLMNYCSVASNTGKPGCSAFNNSYCSIAGANQSYCLTGTSQTYCSQAGASVASSPSCQWLAMRPTTCTASSTDMSCMTTMTGSQLTSLCPSFPNDPLCQSYSAGNVVTQPGTVTTLPITANPLPISTTTVTSLNSVVGSTTSASTATTVPVGIQIKDAAPVSNVWANNSSVLTKLCQSGQMAGCK